MMLFSDLRHHQRHIDLGHLGCSVEQWINVYNIVMATVSKLAAQHYFTPDWTLLCYP